MISGPDVKQQLEIEAASSSGQREIVKNTAGDISVVLSITREQTFCSSTLFGLRKRPKQTQPGFNFLLNDYRTILFQPLSVRG